MNIDRILALVGIAIGLPGLVLLFMSDKWAHGVMVAIIVFVLAAWWIHQKWRDKQPVFTVLLLEKILTVTNAGNARFSRYQKVRVNHKGITEWWCRSLDGDGRILNILIDGEVPDEVIDNGGTIQVCKRFAPKDRGEIWESTLTYDMESSFIKNKEQMVHYTAFKTKKLTMEVVLARPSKIQALLFTFGGQQGEKLAPPSLSNENRTLKVEIKNPRMGGQYHLIWEW